MNIRPGVTFGFAYISTGSNGSNVQALKDVAGTLTAELYHNGTYDPNVTLTVTHQSTGRYAITGTVPTANYNDSDVCEIHTQLTDTVSGSVEYMPLVQFVVDYHEHKF